MNSAVFDHQRAAALAYACPACKAPVGVECSNLVTGQPLTCQPAHHARLSIRPEPTARTREDNPE